MLETIREYARERLDESGRGRAARPAAREFFLALADRPRNVGGGRLRTSLRHPPAGAGRTCAPRSTGSLAEGDLERGARACDRARELLGHHRPVRGGMRRFEALLAGGRLPDLAARPGASLLRGMLIPGRDVRAGSAGQRGEPRPVSGRQTTSGDRGASAPHRDQHAHASATPSSPRSSSRRAWRSSGSSARPAARPRRSAHSATSLTAWRDFERALGLFGRARRWPPRSGSRGGS